MSELAVNWFYCKDCQKDVFTILQSTIKSADSESHQVTVQVDAICDECGRTLSTNEVAATL